MSYADSFNRFGEEVPFGSRAFAAVYTGIPCAATIQMGISHGVAPNECTIEIPDETLVNMTDTIQTVQVDGCIFVGIVVSQMIEETGETITTRIKLVDMRDRLHDFYIFAQFNMLGSDGRWFHLFPVDWEVQIPTYVTTATADQMDQAAIDGDEIPSRENCPGLISSWTILHGLGLMFNFSFSASDLATTILKNTVPENLDWNSGIKGAEAIEQVLQKFGLQVTGWGDLHLHVTMKGHPDDLFAYSIITGSQNLCNITDATAMAFGRELNERGKQIVIVGERNKYEWTYPCRPAWNPGWDFDLTFNDWNLSALLNKSNLTRLDKIRDLPEEYHHPENDKWSGKKINDMTIEEYHSTFPFKVYAVNTDTVLDEDENVLATTNEEVTVGEPYKYWFWDWGDLEPFAIWPINGGPNLANWTYDGVPSIYPFADKLNSDSSRSSIVRATAMLIGNKGDINPFEQGERAPITDGVSVNIDDTIKVSEETCLGAYKVLVVFSTPRFKFEEAEPLNTVKHRPDNVSVTMCVEREVYYQAYGQQQSTGNRVRQIKRDVSNLYRGFINGTEVPVLSQNYGTLSPIHADEIAYALAYNALFHDPVTGSGYITFEEVAGMVPGGLVDSVNVVFGPEGVTETANFTSAINDFAPDGTSYRVIGGAQILKGEKEINLERLRDLARKADMKRRNEQESAKNHKPQVMNERHIMQNNNSFGLTGTIETGLPTGTSLADVDEHAWRGSIMVIRNPDEGRLQVEVIEDE